MDIFLYDIKIKTVFCIFFVYTGGITTLIDMPLNNFPSTVSEETLKLKVKMTNIHFKVQTSTIFIF